MLKRSSLMKRIFFCTLCMYFFVPVFANATVTGYLTFLPTSDPYVTSYNIVMETISSNEKIVISVPQPSNLEERMYVEIDGLQNNTTYAFSVASVNAQGITGKPTEKLLFTTPNTPTNPSRVMSFQIDKITQ